MADGLLWWSPIHVLATDYHVCKFVCVYYFVRYVILQPILVTDRLLIIRPLTTIDEQASIFCSGRQTITRPFALDTSWPEKFISEMPSRPGCKPVTYNVASKRVSTLSHVGRFFICSYSVQVSIE